MIIKGTECRQAFHLGYRCGNPETDKDLRGAPIQSNYIVIVRLADCKIKDHIYDPKDAPALPIVHNSTFSGYGRWRNFHNPSGAWINSCLVYNYRTCPVYFVKHGKVYQGTIRKI